MSESVPHTSARPWDTLCIPENLILPSFCLKRKGRLQKRVFVLAARACYWQIALAAHISRFFFGNSRFLLATRACNTQLAHLIGNSRLLLATHACYRHFAPATGDARSQQATRACYWQFAPVTGKSRLLLETRLFQAARACCWQVAPLTGRLQKRAVSPLC